MPNYHLHIWNLRALAKWCGHMQGWEIRTVGAYIYNMEQFSPNI